MAAPDPKSGEQRQPIPDTHDGLGRQTTHLRNWLIESGDNRLNSPKPVPPPSRKD